MKQKAQVAETANPVQLDSHAVATLRYIRNTMEGAVSFAVPGSAGIAMGATGLTAAAISSLPAFADHWLVIWLVAAGRGRLARQPVGGA